MRLGPAEAARNRPRTSPTSPRAEETQDTGRGNVAPDGTPQSDLFLRNLNDVLKNETEPLGVNKRPSSGIPREQIRSNSRRKYAKIQSAPAGPNRDIKGQAGRADDHLHSLRPTFQGSMAPGGSVARISETRRLEPWRRIKCTATTRVFDSDRHTKVAWAIRRLQQSLSNVVGPKRGRRNRL